MFYRATSVFLLATLALSTSAPTSHDQYVDELLQQLQATYGKKQDVSYDGRRHFVSAAGESQQLRDASQQPQTNNENYRQMTGSRHGNHVNNVDHVLNGNHVNNVDHVLNGNHVNNVDHVLNGNHVTNVLKRANNYNSPLKRPPNVFSLRQNSHAPQFGQLQQLDETIKPRAEEANYESDYDRTSGKRQVDSSLGHVLNKDNNYGAPSNSRQHRDIPALSELQESGEVKADAKLGHVLNKENHYDMPLSGETQPAALTAHDGMPLSGKTQPATHDTQNRASKHGTKDAATSAEHRRTFWKQLPDKIYKNRVHRSI